MKLPGRRERDETRTFKKMGEALGWKESEFTAPKHSPLSGRRFNISTNEKLEDKEEVRNATPGMSNKPTVRSSVVQEMNKIEKAEPKE